MKLSKKLLSVALIATIVLSLYSIQVYAADPLKYKRIGTTETCSVSWDSSVNVTGSLTIPESVIINDVECSVVRIEQNAFSGCKMTELSIPDTVSIIKSGAFSDCTNLTYCKLPAGLISIPDRCFISCYSLNNCHIPETCTTIGFNAFMGCAFTQINIPASVTSIGKYVSSPVNYDYTNCAFGNNKYCTSYNVDPNSTSFKSIGGVLYSYDLKTLIQYPLGRSLVSFTVPNGVETIENYAFAFSNLEEIILPDSVKYIDDDSFKECSVLKSINFPDKLEKIGERAFYKCLALSDVTIPSATTEFSNSFCYSGINYLTVNSGVKSVDVHAFEGCNKLKYVTLPKTVESIETAAFSGCTKLEAINIPFSVKNISNDAFLNCNNTTYTVTTGSYAHDWALQNSKNIVEKELEMTGITVSKLPNKTNYNYKENLDKTGLIISAVFEDESEEILDGNAYQLSNTYFNKTGSTKVLVTYKNFETEFSVNVSYSIIQWIIRILLLGFLWY